MVSPPTKRFRSVARLVSLSLSVAAPALQANVVINEVFYNAPNDLGDLEFVELLNTGEKPVDLSRWELGGGIKFVFPSDSMIQPAGFVVVCKDAKLFPRFYAEESLPPLIEEVKSSVSEVTSPSTAFEVTAKVEGADSVTLRYQVVKPGSAGEEIELPMHTVAEGEHMASVPRSSYEADQTSGKTYGGPGGAGGS